MNCKLCRGRKALLLGSGELGKEVAIELQRYGVEVVACDKYAGAMLCDKRRQCPYGIGCGHIGKISQILAAHLIRPVQYFGYRAHFAGELYVSSASAFEQSTVGT